LIFCFGIVIMPDSRSQDKDPRDEYASRLVMRKRTVALLDREEVRIASLRFLLFLIAAVMTWLSIQSGLFSAWWMAAPLCAFVGLLVIHERVRRRRRRTNRAVSYYEKGISRLENRWAGEGETGDAFIDDSHPYAGDLDIFGKGSLFELISRARTKAGEETLSQWLKAAASPEEVLARQAAVEELRARLDLREDLAVLGTEVRAGVHPEALTKWGLARALLKSRHLRLAALLLAAGATLTLILWVGWGLNRGFFLLAALAELLFALHWRKEVREVVESVEQPGRDLALLSQILARMERESFATGRLRQLSDALRTEGMPASRQIAALNRLIILLDSSRNHFFAPIAAILLWNIQCAYSIEDWRRKSGHCVPRWLAAVGELEALCSLAGYAYENPSDPFPELATEGPCFEGDELGHPLIPRKNCVRNDVRLHRDLRVLVVSGSNMSGKSTLLRTVGINAVLALAGAPVRAGKLRISPMVVGASLQRRDSLQEGVSRFYAEITRLRQLVDLTAGPLSLLFLIDEILAGTNSHDRAIGASAVVQDLVRRNAFGLLTTHDLALAEIADHMAPRAENVHFEDSMEHGKLVFDYRLRKGIVRKSNALELMRSIGLEI
jgi:hypothetical protein